MTLINIKILNKEQKTIIKSFSQDPFFSKDFYWTGGTCLAEIYLKHRLSEDLDFFSDDLFSKDILIYHINQLKDDLSIQNIKYLENKNRQQFLLQFKNNENIKLEFVYFPFSKVKSKKYHPKYGIKIDSIKSIGENKVFALYESAEPKHAFDLYWICKKSNDLSLKKLYQGTVRKFGVEIDKVILLEKALEAIDRMSKIKPLILGKFFVDKNQLTEFFSKQIKFK